MGDLTKTIDSSSLKMGIKKENTTETEEAVGIQKINLNKMNLNSVKKKAPKIIRREFLNTIEEIK